MKKIKVKKAIDLFNEWNKHHRAASTHRSYKSRLKPFKKTFGKRLLKSITPIEIEKFMVDNSRKEDGEMKAPDTRRILAISIERFQNWCVDQGLLKKPLVKRIEKPRGRNRDKIATLRETQDILKTGSREFSLIYRALLVTGARPNEMCRLQVEHIAGNKVILKEHKTAKATGKPRTIVIGSAFKEIINESLNGRESGHVFMRPCDRPWTVASLGRAFRAIREELGIDRELKVYCTRHEHITEVVKSKGIYAGSLTAGHENVTTTQKYAHMEECDYIEAQEAFTKLNETQAA